ncbi:uncharacterized protein HMPREF1541_00722 [Cyphellophora europaea CBS 101466]|uniref:Uncharacterized protein n=1 Tax=Cyphellophora europaea (strain CBS 101466) TaxID=1220924 RepID=W2SCW3_CYPE1|nr:uncharacterized protein HMPREF1541_00722 [Cyphellophora europaea CBS 101466]ETN46537.1 hypothetical protein HMPREF1541_00722 [Cyphellophora europaea CBS 101466]
MLASNGISEIQSGTINLQLLGRLQTPSSRTQMPRLPANPDDQGLMIQPHLLRNNDNNNNQHQYPVQHLQNPPALSPDFTVSNSFQGSAQTRQQRHMYHQDASYQQFQQAFTPAQQHGYNLNRINTSAAFLPTSEQTHHFGIQQDAEYNSTEDDGPNVASTGVMRHSKIPLNSIPNATESYEDVVTNSRPYQQLLQRNTQLSLTLQQAVAESRNHVQQRNQAVQQAHYWRSQREQIIRGTDQRTQQLLAENQRFRDRIAVLEQQLHDDDDEVVITRVQQNDDVQITAVHHLQQQPEQSPQQPSQQLSSASPPQLAGQKRKVSDANDGAELSNGPTPASEGGPATPANDNAANAPIIVAPVLLGPTTGDGDPSVSPPAPKRHRKLSKKPTWAFSKLAPPALLSALSFVSPKQARQRVEEQEREVQINRMETEDREKQAKQEAKAKHDAERKAEKSRIAKERREQQKQDRLAKAAREAELELERAEKAAQEREEEEQMTAEELDRQARDEVEELLAVDDEEMVQRDQELFGIGYEGDQQAQEYEQGDESELLEEYEQDEEGEVSEEE